MELENFENRNFHEILKLVGRSAPKMHKLFRWRDFNALRRPVYYHHMTRRVVLPESNTVTGVIGPVRAENRFYIFGVFIFEFLEIGEFVWSNRIFLIVFSHVAFDWRCHIAKEKRNGRACYNQALLSWNSKISKIENFMKS